MQHLLPWILVSISVALALGAAALYTKRKKARDARVLPTNWALAARPVFNSKERQLHQLLRAALPQQLILAKLPLVRFCQPTDPQQVRYWFGLLGNCHVSFAICSNHGRVLAAVDIEGERQPTRRLIAIKQSALDAVGVRYLRCAAGRLPSVPELQQLLPSPVTDGRAAAIDAGGRPRTRKTLWQDSGFMKDSFYGMDGRGEARIGGNAGSAILTRPDEPLRDLPPPADDFGGVLIDTPVSPLRH